MLSSYAERHNFYVSLKILCSYVLFKTNMTYYITVTIMYADVWLELT